MSQGPMPMTPKMRTYRIERVSAGGSRSQETYSGVKLSFSESMILLENKDSLVVAMPVATVWDIKEED